MNGLRKINELKRKIRHTGLKCTVTNLKGETQEIAVKVNINKLNRLNGNGLTSFNLYELQKKGKTETKDLYGNTFLYELIDVKLVKEEKNEK